MCSISLRMDAERQHTEQRDIDLTASVADGLGGKYYSLASLSLDLFLFDHLPWPTGNVALVSAWLKMDRLGVCVCVYRWRQGI